MGLEKSKLKRTSLSTSLMNLSINFPKGKKYRKVLILSLDAAGKTSFLYRIKTGEVPNTLPTIGYNHETVEFKSSTFDFWDLGGQGAVRKCWDNYFHNVQAVIFIVDSNDRERMDEVISELQRVEELLKQHNRGRAVILILANKQDLPDAMTYHEIHSTLYQARSKKFHWEIKTCCNKTGTGIYEALGWLHTELKKRY